MANIMVLFSEMVDSDRNLGSYKDRMWCHPLLFSSPVKSVIGFWESNARLCINVAGYWIFLAAAEVLHKPLFWYDLRTTGHEFAYGKVNMDPKYNELPSWARGFWSMSVHLGITVEQYLS
ncbi:hypothetical protein M422DRAFT_269705 [Sphaerobolus stellatus SS14]|uniref:Unplaced genomic scaffold SPHSTscaffold_219, whole genome shotgun sequence n=1 Tax=Sphaerobolus stellatus (strain SS14) TaxID=990650 RepID=A0A0C9U413_SPHS4|nr:hypothetical protein M422DRAFT_269705 [Sphaerobolus stellatus SS14]